jgi:hypothetical protein
MKRAHLLVRKPLLLRQVSRRTQTTCRKKSIRTILCNNKKMRVIHQKRINHLTNKLRFKLMLLRVKASKWVRLRHRVKVKAKACTKSTLPMIWSL